MVFTTKRLSYIWIEKCYKAKGAKRSRDENIRHFTKLRKVLPQVVRVYILGATAYKNLAWHLMTHTLEMNENSFQKPLIKYNLIYNIFITFEFGTLTSHHRPSIRCLLESTRICASYDPKRTNPNPFDCPDLTSFFICAISTSP